MHTNFSAMRPTLECVRRAGWRGVLGAYPDHGHFKMPEWQFEEVDMDAATAHAEEWVDECGVSLLGGCCGTGPDLIAAFKRLCERRNKAAP